MSKRDRRRGEMRPRSQRSWRDQTNPRGSTSPAEDDGRAGPTEPAAAPTDQVADEQASGQFDETSQTAGPGGGGKTQWSGRSKKYEGLHGGPSRKR